MPRKGVKKTATASQAAKSQCKEIALDKEDKQTENKDETYSDPEVERQITAITAISDMEMENLLTKIRLFRSYLNEEQLQAPVLQFFRENLPNISVINESDGQVDMKWKHPENTFPLQNVDAKDLYASLLQPFTGLSQLSTAGRDMLDATSILPVGNYALGDSSQPLAFGDGLQTPGANPQRMSLGMTPKTQRQPKQGEMMLSVHGSPLGVFNEETNMESIVESEEG